MTGFPEHELLWEVPSYMVGGLLSRGGPSSETGYGGVCPEWGLQFGSGADRPCSCRHSKILSTGQRTEQHRNRTCYEAFKSWPMQLPDGPLWRGAMHVLLLSFSPLGYSLGCVVRLYRAQLCTLLLGFSESTQTWSSCRFSWWSHGCSLVLYLTLSSVKYSVFKCIWRLLVAELTENSAFFQATICFDHERTFSGIALR